MKLVNGILKRMGCVVCVMIVGCLYSELLAQQGTFPLFKSFFFKGDLDGDVRLLNANNSDASGTEGGKLVRTNRATIVDNVGLQLTTGLNNVGAIILPHHTFTTDDGMLIEFEYIMKYNEEIKPEEAEKKETDGICMFLADASVGVDNINFGAEGAGFGYTNRNSLRGNLLNYKSVRGVQGGYLAVALDQGPFKTWRFESDELINGIVYNRDPNLWGTNPAYKVKNARPKEDNTKSNITIRGAEGKGTIKVSSYELPGGAWGYPVLITRHVGTGATDTNRNSVGYKLQTTTGQYIKEVDTQIDEGFNIAGGADFDSPDEPEYRKAIIKLEPNGKGFDITVTIQHGKTKTPVIEKYTYPTEVTCMESSAVASVISTSELEPFRDPPTYKMSTPRPDKLVIGFSASTGKLTEFTNIIKNLRITTLYSGQSNEDYVEHRLGPVTIRPFDNDWAYGKNGSTIVSGKEYIDPASFRFWKNEKEPHVINPIYELKVDEGRWVYDKETSEVMFFPNKGFYGEVSILYDFLSKDPNYTDGKYRSSLSPITINITKGNQP